MGEPKTSSITIKNFAPTSGSKLYMLGESQALRWTEHGGDVEITLPAKLPGQYAYVLKITKPAS